MTANNNLDPDEIPNHNLSKQHISECVREAMESYFSDMGDHDTTNLYDLVLSQVEKPLMEAVMKQSRGNMTRASKILGLNRGTLRTRLKKYGLDQY